MTRWSKLSALVLLALAACDNRACLAQSDLFAGFRDELIDECCLCLARRGTQFPGAACAEARIGPDGGQVIDADAGPISETDEDEFFGDDLDDVIQDDEVPCICADTAATCRSKLAAGAPLVVTGACISQGSSSLTGVPCGDACRDVLTFDPLTGG